MGVFFIKSVILSAFVCSLCQSASVQKSKRIIIIGAGISGLAAAEHLEEKGFTNYLILEATNRIGGRIKTVYKTQDGNKYPLEIGAGWIHGKDNNPIYDLAEDNDLLRENSWSNEKKNERFFEWNEEYRRQNGTLVPTNVWKRVEQFDEQVQERAGTFYEKGLPNGYNENSSVGAFILNEFYKEFNTTSDPGRWTDFRNILQTRLNYECWADGCHTMDEVSLKYFGCFEELGDDDISLPGGYESIIQTISKNVPSEKILLDQEVLKVEYSKTTAVVKCKNGKTYEADHVIVTSSLGYLKDKATAMFDPPLPERKLSAIQRLGFGTVDRIYLEFENLDFITNPETGQVYFLRSPEELRNPSDWIKKVFTCYVQDVPRANMLTCWLTGKEAAEMETREVNDVSEQLRSLLQQYLSTDVPKPLNTIRSAWSTDEFTKGSYTFIKVGSSLENIKTLAEPLYLNTKPVVMFAGEATHPEHYSTVHGAYLSGVREASRVTNMSPEKPVDALAVMILARILSLLLDER